MSVHYLVCQDENCEMEACVDRQVFRGEQKRLRAEISTLEDAIRKHRAQTGHNMCWENDEELWAILKDDMKISHTPPDWPDFLNKCVAYRASKDK